MTFNTFIILVLAGASAGILSGLLGIGGGIIVVPALVFFLGLSQHEAQGTSLMFMLLPVGALGVMNYYKSGYVNVKFALILSVAFFIGSYYGSYFSTEIPEKLLKKLFGLLFFFVGAKMIFGR